jgi:hypothetical protein
MSYCGFHFQDNAQDWDHAFGESGMNHVKLFQYEMKQRVDQLRPGTICVGRHVNNDTGRWIQMAAESPILADAAADEFILEFRDSLNTNQLQYFESLNEEYPTHDPWKLRAAAEFDRAFIRRLPIHCPGVKPVVFCAAIGNPDHDEYEALVDLAGECEAAGGAFGYHAYWPVYNKLSYILSLAHRRNLHMRWEVIDDFLANEHGIRVKWSLGEAGPIGCNPDGYGLKCMDGWRLGSVWNGDIEGYLSDLRSFDYICSVTQAAQEGRFIGYVLFTTKMSAGGWRWFQVDGQPMFNIAHYTAEDPEPVPFEVIDIVDSLEKHPVLEYRNRPVNGIYYHAVHHTATRSDLTPQEAAIYHVRTKNWPGIGYHFWITVDGTIYQTNRIETESYHVGGFNYAALGTALPGSFIDGRVPTWRQLEALSWLQNEYLPGVLGRCLELAGHKEIPGSQTSCPGDTWDWHPLDECIDPPPDNQHVEVYNCNGLNLRTKPVVSDDTLICTAKPGSVFWFAEEDGDWYKIMLCQTDKVFGDEIEAWGHSNYLRFVNSGG